MKPLFITRRFYAILSIISVLFVLSHFFPLLFYPVFGLMIIFWLTFIADLFSVFSTGEAIIAERLLPEKFSNGDDNPVKISLSSKYRFTIQIKVIDELPVQFQIRNFEINATLESGRALDFVYQIHPVRRGEYHFGKLNVFATGPIGFVRRRFQFQDNQKVPVYPSFIQMRKYELLAISNRLIDVGIKKIRRVCRNNEFDQIKEYVTGDDYRTINWKATARKSRLMVNQYQDEKSQNVVCLIDMGRLMKMPFAQMTLLDYAINTSLVISNIAMLKYDKAGLLTFNEKPKTFLPPDRGPKHLHKIMEYLYNAETSFLESDYEMLYATVRHNIKQRSLLLMFTNFETLVSVNRHLNMLKDLARNHLLVVIIFQNTEIEKITRLKAQSVEEIYIQTIAEKFEYDKKLITKELSRHGIHTLLTRPADLTAKSINKYLEIKSLGII